MSKANENKVVLNEERLEEINEKMKELQAEIPEEDMKILKESMLEKEMPDDIAGGKLSGKAKTALIGFGSLAVGALGAGLVGKNQLDKARETAKLQLETVRREQESQLEAMKDGIAEIMLRNARNDPTVINYAEKLVGGELQDRMDAVQKRLDADN